MIDAVQAIKDAILALTVREAFSLQAEMGMPTPDFTEMLQCINEVDARESTYKFIPVAFIEANGTLKKIQAIKVYREQFGSMLKDAKETVEGVPFKATAAQVEDLRLGVEPCGYRLSRVI